MIHGEIYTGDEIVAHTGRRKLSEIIAEYDARKAAIPDEFAAFKAAQDRVAASICVGGQHFYDRFDTGSISTDQMERLLLKSAWRHAYKEYNLEILASAQDRNRIEQMIENPPAFTAENLYEWFGELAENPRLSILRGLAEVFCDLDPAFRSHEKMKIGVKGLPKRVILTGFDTWGHGWGWNRMVDIINALAAYQGKPFITHAERSVLENDGNAINEGGDFPDPFQSRYERERNPKTVKVVPRGMWLKRFKNGNGHLFFGPEALRDINAALAEYYGEVLPDCPEERPDKQRPGTEVARDLQYYPTPVEVVQRVLSNINLTGLRVLEPSCGCGRFMDGITAAGAAVCIGVEYDLERAQEACEKGHTVLHANFLEQAPPAREVDRFDVVVMNPPFYGKHYAKHVTHALKFLKPGGRLYAILPATARDHGLVEAYRWEDLPPGAFRESGTNICTTIAFIKKEG